MSEVIGERKGRKDYADIDKDLVARSGKILFDMHMKHREDRKADGWVSNGPREHNCQVQYPTDDFEFWTEEVDISALRSEVTLLDSDDVNKGVAHKILKHMEVKK
jgi:hypothetical protein